MDLLDRWAYYHHFLFPLSKFYSIGIFRSLVRTPIALNIIGKPAAIADRIRNDWPKASFCVIKKKAPNEIPTRISGVLILAQTLVPAASSHSWKDWGCSAWRTNCRKLSFIKRKLGAMTTILLLIRLRKASFIRQFTKPCCANLYRSIFSSVLQLNQIFL